MRHESITPKDKEHWLKLRMEDITSTESPALFGISPYMTLFELWHTKKNKGLSSIGENERMQWGTRLQKSIAGGIGEDNGWNVVPFEAYVRIPDLRIGSSFDYRFLLPGVDDDMSCILEIKNVDSLAFKEGWMIDGDNVEAPPHIELQVQHQLLVSGYETAYIGALVGGNRVVLIKRGVDEQIHESIKSKVAAFWKSIEENKEPEPDFKRDAEFIAKLYNKADKDSVTYADQDVSDLAMLYKHAADAGKVADQQKKEYKAKILTKIGKASKVMSDQFTITASEIAPTHVEAFDKKGYRDFKIFFKKDGIND